MPIKSFKKLIQSLYHVRMCVRERLIEIDRERERERVRECSGLFHSLR